MALQNLKDRRQRQKQSEIFNQQEAQQKQEAADEDEDAEGGETTAMERIDLTQSQMAAEQEGKGDANQVDDFDLLEAKIDPKDIRTMKKVAQLQDEIENEKIKIKVKFLFKYSFQTNDPLKISE